MILFTVFKYSQCLQKNHSDLAIKRDTQETTFANSCDVFAAKDFELIEMHTCAGGDCETDYVQFGRDILFITSYRSRKWVELFI